MTIGKWLLATAGLAGISLAGAGVAQQAAGGYAAQLDHGRTVYARNCAACHGADLTGGQFAGTLKGPAFLAKWGDAPLGELLGYIRNAMPPGGGGTLPAGDYAALAAVLLAENGGTSPVPVAETTALAMPPAPSAEEQNALGIGGISSRYPFPAGPPIADRFASYTPVTQAMLSHPAPENWLAWRGGHLGQGFSALDQITPDNVRELAIAWGQALPPGATMAEPLVRDGVMYVFGFGDAVFAFDAATGRQLWRYNRQLPEGTLVLSKKTMALWDDKLIIATSDLHMVALDARTGRPQWDAAIPDSAETRSNGGPLVADGVVMIGLASQRDGGSIIAAFDADDGAHLWNFNTVAQEGTPGGDTWNNLPNAARHGGSVWTSGSYDAETGLALWGVAQTYDTGPVRDLVPGSNNDGLYTNSTLAFVPRTGELRWYYQHMANDQYDLDWVFERVIGNVQVNGHNQRVIITGGKEGLFDIIDAATGRYLATADMGFQTFITAIDPVTGRKTPDPALLPGRDRDALFMCPHAGGGRNWSPSAFVEATGTLFINARDTCMELRPRAEGGFLTSGVDVYFSAPPESDGNFGILQGIDIATGTIRWEHRRRAPYDAGVLATASGLLFTGGMDQSVLAYDQATGTQLWRSGLAGVPNASPITYAVDGRQYVAFVTGIGNPLAFGLPGFTPEIPLPEVNSAAVYVFALPE